MLKVVILFLLIITVMAFYITLTQRAPQYTPEEAREVIDNTNISFSVDNLIEQTLKGDTRVVRLLLQAEMDPEVSYEGHPLLYYALKDLNTEIAELIVQYAKKEQKAHDLAWSIRNNNLEMVEFLIERGADIDYEEEGIGVIGMALDGASEEIGVYLLNKKAAVGDYIDVMNKAALNGWQQFTEMLLGNKADVNAADLKGRTPIIYASLGGKHEMVQYLISKGADYDIQDEYGITPLMIASKKGYHEVVRKLLAAGADTEKKDRRGRTALSVACSDFIREILQGQDPEQ